ncbi:hypothetical protein LCGC14_2311290, partial [marine sediment metagenome]|nr:MAG: hypothetical protein Lokiarch_40050 [Candidatus Lokiarchaeum sp. GC14_75]
MRLIIPIYYSILKLGLNVKFFVGNEKIKIFLMEDITSISHSNITTIIPLLKYEL